MVIYIYIHSYNWNCLPQCWARNIMRGARDAINANPTQVSDYALVMLKGARQVEQLALSQVATQLVADDPEERSIGNDQGWVLG